MTGDFTLIFIIDNYLSATCGYLLLLFGGMAVVPLDTVAKFN